MDERWTPYRHPQPKESPPELVVAQAIPTDERVWVPLEPNVWFRPLLLSASGGYWMNLLRVRKSGVLSRHRHPLPVHGLDVVPDGGDHPRPDGTRTYLGIRPWQLRRLSGDPIRRAARHLPGCQRITQGWPSRRILT